MSEDKGIITSSQIELIIGIKILQTISCMKGILMDKYRYQTGNILYNKVKVLQ